MCHLPTSPCLSISPGVPLPVPPFNYLFRHRARRIAPLCYVMLCYPIFQCLPTSQVLLFPCAALPLWYLVKISLLRLVKCSSCRRHAMRPHAMRPQALRPQALRPQALRPQATVVPHIATPPSVAADGEGVGSVAESVNSVATSLRVASQRPTRMQHPLKSERGPEVSTLTPQREEGARKHLLLLLMQVRYTPLRCTQLSRGGGVRVRHMSGI